MRTLDIDNVKGNPTAKSLPRLHPSISGDIGLKSFVVNWGIHNIKSILTEYNCYNFRCECWYAVKTFYVKPLVYNIPAQIRW